MTRFTVRPACVASGAAIVLLVGSLAATGLRGQPAPGRQTAKVFELAITNGRVAAAAETVRVSKGDDVELRWTSDRAITLHLHGYDIEHRVTPQAPSTMAFNA